MLAGINYVTAVESLLNAMNYYNYYEFMNVHR